MLKKVLKFLLQEARDWLFAISGIVGLIILPRFIGENPELYLVAAGVFIFLYAAAFFVGQKLIDR